VVLFGATGMVGQGVLRECLLDPDVESVIAIVRNSSLPLHHKLREIVHQDVSDLSVIEDSLSGYDACFFCLGVSAVRMEEEAYRRVTCDLTISVNPAMTFIYVSGAGTDSAERGRMMWARVKGRTENALFEMPFEAVYLFRPAYIQPLHGIRTKARWYGAAYALMKPLNPLLKTLFAIAVWYDPWIRHSYAKRISAFLDSPGFRPEKATRIRTSPSRGCGSSILPMTNTSRAAPCFSYQAALMSSHHPWWVLGRQRLSARVICSGSLVYGKSCFHPALLSFRIMRHVFVTHCRQCTGGVFAGVSMRVGTVRDDLSVFVRQQLRGEFVDPFRRDVQCSGDMSFAVSFWGERLDDCDLFLVEFGFEVLRRNRSIHIEPPCRTLRLDEVQFVPVRMEASNSCKR
jgi:hypothetical protein